MKVLEKYDEIMNIILPTLRGEKKNLLSIFTDLSSKWKGIEIPLKFADKKNGNLTFDNGSNLETNILDGNCKLQWKVDWAMRWFYIRC